MRLYEDNLGLGEQEPNSKLFVEPSSEGIGMSPEQGYAPPAGIGLGAEQAPAPVVDVAPRPVVQPVSRAQQQQDLRRQTIDAMGGGERFLSALGEFGAAVQGRASPLDARIKEQREEKLLQVKELKEHIDALESGNKIAKTLQGPARESFVKDYAAQLEQMRPGLGASFMNVSQNPGLLDNFKQYMPYLPPLVQAMIKTNPDEAIKHFGTPPGLKTLQDAEEQYQLTEAEPKVRSLVTHFDQLAQYGVPQKLIDEAKADPKASTFKKINNALPDGHPMKMSDEQIRAVDKHADVIYGALGVMTPKTEQQVLADAGKAENKQVKIEWVGRPGGMKQQARIDRDGNVLGYIGDPIPAHAPASVQNNYSSSVTPGVNAKGESVFLQPSPRADTPPRIIENVYPPERADQRKRNEKDAEGQRIWQSVDRQITELEHLITATEGKFTSATGVKGLVTRVGEAATGAVNPDAATPALDAKNKKELLVASLRKTMADSNMSKADKDALETAIGGIESSWGTKGSTLRGLNSLRTFVREKYSKESNGGGADKFTVGQVYQDAKGNKAKYLGGGKWENQ